MADNDESDKTEPASNRRRREARRQGHVWQSGDLSAALTLGGVGLLLSWQGAALTSSCGDWLRQSFAAAPIVRSDRLGSMADSPSLTELAGSAVGLLLGLWLIAVIVRLLQVGPLFVPQLVQPQIERVSLLAGWRRMTSAAMVFRGPLWMLKLFVICGIVWWTVTREAGTLAGLSHLEPVELADSLRCIPARVRLASVRRIARGRGHRRCVAMAVSRTSPENDGQRTPCRTPRVEPNADPPQRCCCRESLMAVGCWLLAVRDLLHGRSRIRRQSQANRHQLSAIASPVGPQQRKQDGVVAVPVEKQALTQNAFANRTDFDGDLLAGEVADGSHDLQSIEVGLAKRPVGQKPDGLRGDSLTPLRRPQPVTEVGRAVHRIEVIESASPQKPPLGVLDDEAVRLAIRPLGGFRCDPLPGFVDRVPGVTPRHPRLHGADGLASRFVERFHVVGQVAANANVGWRHR